MSASTEMSPNSRCAGTPSQRAAWERLLRSYRPKSGLRHSSRFHPAPEKAVPCRPFARTDAHHHPEKLAASPKKTETRPRQFRRVPTPLTHKPRICRPAQNVYTCLGSHSQRAPPSGCHLPRATTTAPHSRLGRKRICRLATNRLHKTAADPAAAHSRKQVWFPEPPVS